MLTDPEASRVTDRSLNVDVIVCVHNGLEFVGACLNSVASSLGKDDALIVVDDGSDDPTQRLCADFVSGHPQARLIRRPAASGFTRAANAGLSESSAAYQILLNSDTVVPRGWLDKIVACGESAPDIGLVGPLSNAASWQSIPRLYDEHAQMAVNALPPEFDVERMDEECELLSAGLPYPRTSLLNGFCLAIKKQLRAEIGLLDEVNFPNGYGEENDYCCRTIDAGFALLVAIDTYVFHEKTKTYGSETRKALIRAGSEKLRAKHGRLRIERAVRSMKEHPILVEMRRRYLAAMPLVPTTS